MKSYHLFSKCVAGILALTGALSGCTHEEQEESREVPLRISASFPAYSGEISTRAGSNTTVLIALDTQAGSYASSAKTYKVTSPSPGIAFEANTPGDELKIPGSAMSTPLTIYGWLDENTPVCYSNSSQSVNNGSITGISLSPAYACIGVRILKDGQTEDAGKYTIGSTLAGIGTFSTNSGWNTEEQRPKLKGYPTPSEIKNTDKTTISTASDITTEHFMRVTPQAITVGNANLFTVTLPDNSTLPVPAGTSSLTIEPGHCYLFTVNISRNAELEIGSIEVISMTEKKDIAALQGNTEGIYTLDDLKAFRDAVNEDNSLARWSVGDVVQLYMDIDMKNEEWTPIENLKVAFNGNGHTISNLNIPPTYISDSYEAVDHLGFFCNATSEIKGLTINGATLGDGRYNRYVGVIAGKSTGAIIDCHVKGRIQINGTETAGGIAGIFDGDQQDKIIALCTAETDGSSFIKAPASGGIVGQWEGSSIVGCIAHDITFGTGSEEVTLNERGGIAGKYNTVDQIIGCIAYNCQGSKALNTGGILTGSSSPVESCYFYNVLNVTENDPNDYAEGYLDAFDKLNSPDIIKEMNRQMDLNGFEYHYEASANPTTGPTIHTGSGGY